MQEQITVENRKFTIEFRPMTASLFIRTVCGKSVNRFLEELLLEEKRNENGRK